MDSETGWGEMFGAVSRNTTLRSLTLHFRSGLRESCLLAAIDHLWKFAALRRLDFRGHAAPAVATRLGMPSIISW